MSEHEDELVPVWTADGHLDEGTIHTWLDGAFDSTSSAAVSAHVDECAVCRETVAEARGLIAGASRMVRSLDVVPAGVVPHEDVVRTASRIVAAAQAVPLRVRPWYMQPVLRSAAAIGVMIAGGSYVWSRTPVESRAVAEAIVPPTVVPAAAERDAKEKVSTDAAVMMVPPAQPASVPLPAPRAKASSANVATNVVAAEAKSEQIGRDIAKRDVAKGVESRADARMADARVADARVAGARVAGAASAEALGMTTQIAPPSATASAPPPASPAPVVASAPLATAPVATAAKALPEVARQRGASAFAAATPTRTRAEDEPVPSHCWTMQGDTVQSMLRLPSELHLPDIDGARSYATRWIGWPDASTTLMVRMRVDNDGRLVGESVSNEQHVRLIMQRVVGGWQGTATHTIDGKRTTSRVQMKSVPALMCNP